MPKLECIDGSLCVFDATEIACVFMQNEIITVVLKGGYWFQVPHTDKNVNALKAFAPA